MKIIKAQISDSDELSKIAYQAKSFWKYPESWLEIWKEDLTITPEFIAQNEVYRAVENSRTIGFYALILKGKIAQLEHLWILPEKIGGGIGKCLMKDALQKAKFLGATSMEIVSEPNAEGFYQKQGAIKIGENKSEIEGKPRILPIMKIEL